MLNHTDKPFCVAAVRAMGNMSFIDRNIVLLVNNGAGKGLVGAINAHRDDTAAVQVAIEVIGGEVEDDRDPRLKGNRCFKLERRDFEYRDVERCADEFERGVAEVSCGSGAQTCCAEHRFEQAGCGRLAVGPGDRRDGYWKRSIGQLDIAPDLPGGRGIAFVCNPGAGYNEVKIACIRQCGTASQFDSGAKPVQRFNAFDRVGFPLIGRDNSCAARGAEGCRASA